VLKNSDELFEREELSAAPDPGWPDCFNSGVFVYRPSLDTFSNLIKFAVSKGSFDGKSFNLFKVYLMLFSICKIKKHNDRMISRYCGDVEGICNFLI
jgi:Glycosyl transferase family 8.